MHLNEWAESLADRLTAATGVPIATDERNLRIPGGLLYLDRLDPARLGAGVWDADWTLALLATPPTGPAMTELGRMAGLISDAEAGLEWEALAVAMPNHGPDPLPVLQTTIQTECEDT